MEASVIVCGLGQVGRRVVEFLRVAGVPVVVIDTVATNAAQLPAGVEFVLGDCRKRESLERAGVATARGVVIVTSEDLVNISAALLVRSLNPKCRVVARMFNQNLLTRLGAAVPNTTALSVSALTAPLLVLSALTGDQLGAFPFADGAQLIAEIPVTPGSALAGRTLADVARQYRWLVLAHRDGMGALRRLQEVPGDRRLAAGDRVVVCGRTADVSPLTAAGAEGGDAVRWAGRVRRLGRTLGRTVAAVDLPVKLGAAALGLTLLGSTAVFRYGLGSTWGEGLYEAVGVIATGGDLHGEGRPEWAKVFLSLLKIVGIGLIAGFTAIVTQYLLRLRLGGAFEVRRIPDGGHVVVCGLGNLGFRCVEELTRLGHSVVAVETDERNPYVPTVRRMGTPVVIGDAAVPAVLRQARCDAARAVIACADAELVNLEIALLVRDVNPRQRVVVRLNDEDFARVVREAADIKLALAVPALAAPAFAAALYGDRVLTLFTLGDASFAVVELTVAAGFESLLAVAMADYRFVPVGLTGRPPFALDGIPTGHRLTAGDRLTVIVAMADLDSLLRREAASRGWRVVIEGHLRLTAETLIPIVRSIRACTEEEAASFLESPRFVLAENLTRGEAEELSRRMARERVEAHVEAGYGEPEASAPGV